MSRTLKLEIKFVRLKRLRNHAKIWTTLSINSENLLCSYRRTSSSSVILLVSYVYRHSSYHSELEQLRTQTQTAQTESASAASQTAAMMSLNLKLQSSAMKNLARNIDFELKSLEARQSKELLSIVQVRVPFPLSLLRGFRILRSYLVIAISSAVIR